MDSDGLLFHIASVAARPSMPLPCPTVMPAQSIVPWTLASMASAFVNWLMAETPIAPLAPAAAPVPMHRGA